MKDRDGECSGSTHSVGSHDSNPYRHRILSEDPNNATKSLYYTLFPTPHADRVITIVSNNNRNMDNKIQTTNIKVLEQTGVGSDSYRTKIFMCTDPCHRTKTLGL